MAESCKNLSRIRAVWMGLLMVALLFAYVPAQAAEKIEVPVKLTVLSEEGEPKLDDEITIEAVTEKKGDYYEAFFTNVKESAETKIVDGHYVSRVTFQAEYIGEKTFDYSISMHGEGQAWVGHASVTIRVKDNMPGVIPSVDSGFVISPSKNLIVGQKIKFTVTTPYKGEITKEGNFHFYSMNSVDDTQKVEQVRTVRRGNFYVTTGYFTPKIPGTYMPFFFNKMQDEKTKEVWEGIGFYKFEVKENPTIAVSLSPNTAYMKAGEEIYLTVTYPLNKDSGSSEHYMSWNNPSVVQFIGTYDDDLRGYKYIYRFKPAKKGTYTLEVSVKQDSSGQIRVGKAKTKIYVR
ncbi:hypothetical protein [Brevibacillus choshinensis]|uniref:Uncharacterized protein n=1 Tax=Brevibacillus choshinensis TaxID=54911 RepID=A0ABX7FRC5_BRECH|nr:hypothetical protein [Brevibacillus choshinensis]QRG68808.1 hypothetical protein JNE38_06575 [Brevibacillus choshinensis]